MEETIQELEKLVRQGQFDLVAQQLKKLGPPERKEAAVIAKIARRSNQPALAVRILNPIVRAQDKLAAPATQIEKIEYAEALRRIGAIEEAWNLLEESDHERYPEAILYQVFCLFNQWNYADAIPLLQRYLKNDRVGEYERCVAKINLAAALIYTRDLEQARRVLDDVQAKSDNADMALLRGNSFELGAQILIFEGKYAAGIELINESKRLLKNAGTVFSLFPEKWMAIAASLQKGAVTEELRTVFAKALAAKHWETVRDCDLYISVLDQNWDQVQRIYFSTPFEGYRRRVRDLAGAHLVLPAEIVYSLKPNPPSLLNLTSGTVQGLRQGSVPIGQALHRFLILLSRDLYRPLLAVTAFGKLFPEEYVSETSANRVHQIVKRCRLWLAEIDLGLQIEELDGGYRLKLAEDVGLTMPLMPLPLDGKELECLLLEKKFGGEFFNVNQAKGALASSISNTQRLLRWAVQEGRLEKEGQGSRTRYRVKSG